ncbi:MAG: phosphatidylserine/phosphatidylglycerophosphate/cardiolipin synthase family protein [Sphaerochaeta sp.]
MKRVLLPCCTFFLLSLLVGCTSTSNLVKGPSVDTSLSLEQKMESYDIPKIEMTYPTIYYDGQLWRERVMELVRSSEDYIIISSFLASSAESLDELYSLIAQKAEEGVRVYFIVDGTGAFDMTETRFHLIPLKFLRDSGVHLLEYNPMSAARLVAGPKILLRDHRKYLIVDGKHLAIGGMNLNYISIGEAGNDLQRDSMYEFASPELCEVMLDGFVASWNEQTWDEVRREDFPVDYDFGKDEEQYTAWFANQSPLSDMLAGMFGSLLSEAKVSVKALPFLPFFDQPLLSAFRQTGERGVDVEMLVPFDSRVSNRKGIEFMAKDLLSMHINLRIEIESEESQRLLHEKLMIVDSRYVVIGSSNLNYRSLTFAYEMSLVIDSPALAREMEAHFATIYENTVPITKEQAELWRRLDNWPRYAFGIIGG